MGISERSLPLGLVGEERHDYAPITPMAEWIEITYRRGLHDQLVPWRVEAVANDGSRIQLPCTAVETRMVPTDHGLNNRAILEFHGFRVESVIDE